MTTNQQRCSKCILSSSFPNIEFNEEGICNFCDDQLYSSTEERTINESQSKISKLFESKKGTAEYDAVMCYSGGKDSTYTLMTAVRKYRLKVLSFTLDNGFISPVAFDNINRVVECLGVDQLTIRPSANFFKPLIAASALNRIYSPKTLVRISSVCNSCISIVNNSALKLALEKEIPLILAGFTIGQIPANAIIYKNNYNFFQESREPYLNKLRRLLGNSVDEYFCIKDSLLKRTTKFPYNINLLCIEDPTEAEMLREIRALGWTSPKDVDGCSSNCRLNGFNNLVHQKTFGYSPYELELSHLIRKGKITREEGLKKISDQLDESTIHKIMDQLGISEADLDSLVK